MALLGTSLVSCGSSDEVSLTDAQSRDVRLASGVNLIANNGVKSVYGLNNAAAVDSTSKFSLAFPSLDILAENNFKVDADVEGDANSKTITYNGATYNFKETIKYKDNNEEETSIVLYYNYVNEATDKNYSENIEGVVSLNNSALVNFTSTAYTENGYDKRDLELYVGTKSTTSLVISEETSLKDGKEYHVFDYTFKLLGVEYLSYSINLDRNNLEMTLNVLTASFTVTRKASGDDVTYTITSAESTSGASVTYTFSRVIKDGEVSYEMKLTA